MPVTQSDLIKIPITREMNSVAHYFAEKRMLYEYPRQGYGEYDQNHIAYIESSMLGELGTLEFLHHMLSVQYGSLDPTQRWEVLHKQVGLAYMIVIGRFDEGFEFRLGVNNTVTVDVKTYHTNRVTDSQIFNGLRDDKANPRPLNLFIDSDQHASADIYIQAFLSPSAEVVLSGYWVGLPPRANWMPNPAYTKAVPDLEPMITIRRFFAR